MLWISATPRQVRKSSGSSIQRWVMKKVARNPSSFSRGATTVRWDFTASSKVRTTTLSGTGRIARQARKQILLMFVHGTAPGRDTLTRNGSLGGGADSTVSRQ